MSRANVNFYLTQYNLADIPYRTETYDYEGRNTFVNYDYVYNGRSQSNTFLRGVEDNCVFLDENEDDDKDFIQGRRSFMSKLCKLIKLSH